MAPQQILSELDSIIAYADGLKLKASTLRKKLTITPVKVSKKKPLSKEQVAEVLMKSRKRLNN